MNPREHRTVPPYRYRLPDNTKGCDWSRRRIPRAEGECLIGNCHENPMDGEVLCRRHMVAARVYCCFCGKRLQGHRSLHLGWCCGCDQRIWTGTTRYPPCCVPVP